MTGGLSPKFLRTIMVGLYEYSEEVLKIIIFYIKFCVHVYLSDGEGLQFS